MALLKEFNYKNGTSGNYIRINYVMLNNGSNTASIFLQIWKDAQTRQSGIHTPIEEIGINAEVNLVGNDIIQACYEAVKLNPDFVGAQDT